MSAAARFALASGLLASALLGCNPGVGGDWDGAIECPDGQFEVELALNRLDFERHEGDFELVGEQTIDQDGSSWRIELDIDSEIVVLMPSATGQQELRYQLDDADATCALYQDGGLVEDDCEALELDLEQDYDEDAPVFGTWTWDGEDTIEVEDGDCTGELER